MTRSPASVSAPVPAPASVSAAAPAAAPDHTGPDESGAGAPHQDFGDTPRLPRIRRRLMVVGISALAMVGIAIAASLTELVRDVQLRHRYEETLAISRLAFDAESLATRLHALQDLSAEQNALASGASPALRNAVRALDIDLAEWERRIADAAGRDLPLDARGQIGRLQPAIDTMRAALAPVIAIPGAATAGVAAKADFDRAYLAAVEAAQGTLLSAVRAGGDRAVIAGRTAREITSAIIVGASILALALGAAHVALLNQERHESRAALGVMGEMLRTDPLTGITNRRGLDENLPVEMARAKRNGTTLTVAMLDLDFFKRYNSRRGHAGGDSLLRTASQSWRRQLRPTDTLVRYGGEEFTLVLPSCASEQACQLIARLRPVLPDNQTFSAGVATWDFEESGEALLRRADQALLLAKKTGRNRTIVSGREEQISLPLSAG